MTHSAPSAPVEVISPGVRERLLQMGRPVPELGEPLRVAFVGPAHLAPRMLEAGAPGVEALLVEWSCPGPASALRDGDAHVAFVFDPAGLPADALRDSAAVVVGWLSRSPREPLDPAGFDRLVAADPGRAPGLELWRSLPLPVGDSLYAEHVESAPGLPARPLYLGSVPPEHRSLVSTLVDGQGMLTADDPSPEELRALLARATIGINVDGTGFDDRVPLHLAAGHALISHRLDPDRGVVAGADFLEVANLQEVLIEVWRVQSYPEAFNTLRRSARQTAELFRASRVYPRLVADALRDVATFGSPRVFERAATRSGLR